MNILNLPDFDILEVKESDHDYLIVSDYIPEPAICPHCGAINPRLRCFGTKRQLFMDLPIHAKRVGICVVRQRYQCQECNQTFYECLPDMDSKRLMTKRLVEYIERESLKRLFVNVAEDIGVDEKTVRNVFRDYSRRLEAEFTFETSV